jgi:nucleoside-diphosphate-sugar epimerase
MGQIGTFGIPVRQRRSRAILGRRKIAVAGATGRVGHDIVDVLRAGGYDIVAMSRSSEWM